MIMNLQLFASYKVRTQGDDGINTGIYFTGGRTYQEENMDPAYGTYNVNAYVKEGWEYVDYSVNGVVVDGVGNVTVSNEDGVVSIAVYRPSKKGTITLYSRPSIGNFHVTEPVTITVNNVKLELLATIQPMYAANGALMGTILREPYQLIKNDAVLALIRQGVLVEAPPTNENIVISDLQ